ncbi:chemotaxis response regulator protein-glutamate methylesterase [Carboxylicivirga sp. A043]|uniref:protein-glutamate methylesterase/protein-glutamine glutaminase n=1 Tax=Carboxylicivirga litoralis TaxID=2816963 RepID=UPI0021CB2D02|nr:chemotaxis response regulator protein-glutamate methylesterase [Carboxylicivirga sp. A043]MCU4155178.1 chemotaxis response regulator protein-glutamate methylesterase [Carboxylicivirga sp. A043]
MKKKIRVLVVDDSAVVRQSLSSILESDPGIEVMGTAADPIIAVKKIQKEIPDVITLDIEMPRMDGLTFLRKIMSQHPIPVVVISSLTTEGTEVAMKALEYGASEIIGKPAMNAAQFINESKIMLCDAVKAASQVKLKRRKIATPVATTVKPKYSADVILNKASSFKQIIDTEKVVVLGASTGGTEAIRNFLKELPAKVPGIAIVQHMPEGFTKSFANSLNNICGLEVKEAENGDKLYQGRVLIAPGSKHMLLKRVGKEYMVEVKEGPLVNRHRPSVDVLFRSAARYAGNNATGILLTGMGNDGAKGLLELKESGAHTVAQDEASSVVFGMPKEAIKLNAADKVMPLDKMASYLLSRLG